MIPSFPKTDFHCIVIGAGPAGGQCARELSHLGYRVLVVERVEDFSKNNFSSGVTPMETIEQFSLPTSVIGTYWDSMCMRSDQEVTVWQAPNVRGAVFDFKKLKEFLVHDAHQAGARILMHTQFVSFTQATTGEYTVVIEHQKTHVKKVYTYLLMVDASGPARVVLGQLPGDLPIKYILAPGMEYMVKIKKGAKEISPTTLQFLIGRTYAPNGYSWIFPMGNGVFKVGMGADSNKSSENPNNPLVYYVEKICHDFIGAGKYEIIEKHGSTVKCMLENPKIFFSDHILGVGDSVYTIYPFVGEGIRHALYSGHFAAESIDFYLQGKIPSLERYQQRMKKYMGIKWLFGAYLIEFFGKQGKGNQQHLHRVIRQLKACSFDEVFDMLFHYKLRIYLKVGIQFYTSVLLDLLKR